MVKILDEMNIEMNEDIDEVTEMLHRIDPIQTRFKRQFERLRKTQHVRV